MTTLKSLILAATLTLAAAAGLNVGSASAGVTAGQASVRPLAGLSMKAGLKRVIGYYAANDGACDLTLFVSDTVIDGGPVYTDPARFVTKIAGGQTARVDTANGPSVELKCAIGAASMDARVMERVANTAVAK